MERQKEVKATEDVDSVAGQIAAVCDSFEALWRQGRRPDIADFLKGLVEPFRSKLL